MGLGGLLLFCFYGRRWLHELFVRLAYEVGFLIVAMKCCLSRILV